MGPHLQGVTAAGVLSDGDGSSSSSSTERCGGWAGLAGRARSQRRPAAAATAVAVAGVPVTRRATTSLSLPARSLPSFPPAARRSVSQALSQTVCYSLLGVCRGCRVSGLRCGSIA